MRLTPGSGSERTAPAVGLIGWPPKACDGGASKTTDAATAAAATVAAMDMDGTFVASLTEEPASPNSNNPTWSPPAVLRCAHDPAPSRTARDNGSDRTLLAQG